MSALKLDLSPPSPVLLKVGEEELVFRPITLSDEVWFVGQQKDKEALDELQRVQVALALHQLEDSSRETFDRLTGLNTIDLTRQDLWDEAAKLVCDTLQRPQMQPLMETVVILQSRSLPDAKAKETGEENAEAKKRFPTWTMMLVSFLAGWAACLLLTPFLV